MKLKLLNTIAIATVILTAAVTTHAQRSQYYNEVQSLNPVGYWPMHETNAPAPGNTETNYGSLGLQGTGFYPDWEPIPTTDPFLHTNGPVPFANDPDQCLAMACSVNTGSGFVDAWFTNALYIPRVSSEITLLTNWTVECWIKNFYGVPQSGIYKGVIAWAEYGFDNLNYLGTANGGGDGWSLNWNSLLYFQSYSHIYPSQNISVVNPWLTNQWGYIVVTCDGGTNVNTYYNGTQYFLQSSYLGKITPDTWTPFALGGGRGGTRSFAGLYADFAIYTNVLSPFDIANKWTIATNTASTNGAYWYAVTNDQPVVYYRMNSHNYTPPAINTWPPIGNAAITNGVPVAGGVYTPGTAPGILSGPFNPNGFSFGGVTNGVPMLSGISSYADVGSAPVYNVTGSNANFTVTAMFRGNPCDGRFNSIVSHGTNSWQLAVSTNGSLVFNAGNAGPYAFNTGATWGSPGDMHTMGVYNDGNWHEVVAINQTNQVSIYVDGVLDTNGIPAGIATTNIISGNGNDVLIGADPSYTNYPVGVGRQFAGQVCEVAFFNYALTPAQVQALYNVSGVAPYFLTQPGSAQIDAGSAFTNPITAGGSTPIHYQWYTNGVAIGGQTNASFGINPITPNYSSSDYYVVAANSYGSATSAVASVSVYVAPTVFGEFPVTFTNQVDASNPNIVTNFMTLYAGADPTFSISALGESLCYFWYTNGVVDGAATSYSFTMPNAAQIGSFNVYGVVSNFANSVTSVVWSANVVADPPTNGVGYAPYPQQVLALHPLGYWRLNEPEEGSGDDGFLATDFAGGNNAIYTNASLGYLGYNVTTDPSDTACYFSYYFDQTSDAGTIGGSIGNGVDFATPVGSNAEFSVECWVDFVENNKNCGLVSKGWYNGGEEFAIGSSNSGANPYFLVRDANGNAYAASATFTPTVGQWYHLCGVCDEANGVISFYVNGSLAGTNTIPHDCGILYDNAQGMTIGSQPSNLGEILQGVNDLQSYAVMNDVAVFNYALTGSQVSSEYDVAAFPPSIGTQPTPLTYAARGSSPTITASITGTLPMTDILYETNVVTQTTTPAKTNVVTSSLSPIVTFTIANISTNDSWFISSANSFGMTNTLAASIVVYSNPLITTEFPITLTNKGNTSYMRLYPGASPKFSVAAFGLATAPTATATNYYQWFTNGVATAARTVSPTAIATTYSMANVQSSFNIFLVMSNSFGAVTSTVWSATLVPLPHSVGGGNAFFPQQVMALNPVEYWPLNEADDGVNDGNPGVIAYDYAAGNNGIYTNTILGNTGTNQYNPLNDPAGTSAQFGYFNTANSMVECIGTNVDFTASSSTVVGLTAEAWVNWTVLNTNSIFSKGYIGGSEFDMIGQYNTPTGTNAPNMFPRFDLRGNSGADYDGVGGPVATNTWYLLVGVCDEVNNITTLYCNGVPDGSFGMAGHLGILGDNPAYDLVIGAASRSAGEANNGFAPDQTCGYVSDVAIYNFAFTPSQVQNQYLLGGQVAPSFTLPSTWTTNAGQTLVIPVSAQGTPTMGYVWTNVTTGAAIGSGTTNNSGTLNAVLSYPNVPISWNGDELELTVTNAYGSMSQFLTLSVSVNLTPTNIVTAVTNNQLYLTWPTDHIGWQLQLQTNTVSKGISTNWVNNVASTGTNRVVVPMSPANGCVFYRLVYP